MSAKELNCPFCGYRTDDGYVLTLHVEELHTVDSPFVIREQTRHDRTLRQQRPERTPQPGVEWVKCTRPGCGELVLIADIDQHLDLHLATEISEEEARHKPTRRRRRHSTSPHRPHDQRTRLQKPRPMPESPQSPAKNGTLDNWFKGRSIVSVIQKSVSPKRGPSPSGRLGTRELGPHAFEKRMPDKVREKLILDSKPKTINRIGRGGRLVPTTVIENETSGLIDVLCDLSVLDPDIEAAYFCRRTIRHIRRIDCEGNFCGYWNIQMMLSCLRHLRHLPVLPNVLEIQDTIERAWDAGICAYGRTETGGIRNSRKWIGSNEAAAYLAQTGIAVDAQSFKSDDSAGGVSAHTKLLDHVEAYFMSTADTAERYKTSRVTDSPPIFLQRQGHSVTIVGIERFRDGSRELLVFDPSFATAKAMRPLLDERRTRASPGVLMKPYRRDEEYLGRWREYEIVTPVDKQS